MKPGKPVALAVLDGTPFYGLPGNPVSSMVGVLAVRAAGHPRRARLRAAARSAARHRAPRRAAARRAAIAGSYLRARLRFVDGRLVATPMARQGSGVLTLDARRQRAPRHRRRARTVRRGRRRQRADHRPARRRLIARRAPAVARPRRRLRRFRRAASGGLSLRCPTHGNSTGTARAASPTLCHLRPRFGDIPQSGRHRPAACTDECRAPRSPLVAGRRRWPRRRRRLERWPSHRPLRRGWSRRAIRRARCASGRTSRALGAGRARSAAASRRASPSSACATASCSSATARRPASNASTACGAGIFSTFVVGAAHTPVALRLAFDRSLHLGPAIFDGGGMGAGFGGRL